MRILRVRVTPKASSNRIMVETGDGGEVLYKVYVTVVPEDGKANAAVIKLLAKHFDVAKSALEITQGLNARDKVVQLKE